MATQSSDGASPAMIVARILVVLIGILLPYLVRIPGGSAWVAQYTDVDWPGYLFFGAFNAIAWGSMVAISWWYRHPISLAVPVAFGFGFLGWTHYSVDLTADAQAALALIFIPIYALPAIAAGGGLGYLLDRYL